ncbi:leucyl aminopeptidase [Utexia brackfieldae]|uniref:leucyl aminopeptidase n=1 Tax=Utexia brackfieldae TaxID=3074108 RepID=UPI00370DCDC4
MDFLVKSVDVTKQRSQCIILSVFANQTLTGVAQQIDQLADGLLTRLIKQGELNTALGETTLLYQIPQLKAEKVLIVGAGDEKSFDQKGAKRWIQAVAETLKAKSLTEAMVIYSFNDELDGYLFGRAFAEIVVATNYRFEQFKSKPSKLDNVIKKLTLITANKTLQQTLKQAITEGNAIAQGIRAAKDLANLPPNICNPDYLAKQGLALAKDFASINTTVLDEKQLSKLGMNAYLAVGQGSDNESKLTVMEYYGAKDKKAKPIVLVGKGLTFDSGGISIKPAAGMDEMKYDMCGAATVYGVMQAVASLNLPLNVVGLMAGCENMPSSGAYRPGDILTTMSGLTVEVINTDAEGRLVLCDTLTYAARFNPQYVIDIATLTGACIIALGHHYTGVMANDNQLAKRLLNAAEVSGDKAWQLPLDEDFQKQIDSSIADIVNAGGRDGGTITAGCFLSRFTQDYQWAHLDIAGTAWTSGAKKGATGRPVAMLLQFLLAQTKETLS